MSRKDTIVIALLINAGLLALLFMLAINSNDDAVNDQPEINKALTENSRGQPVQMALTPIAMDQSNKPQEPDEVDSFLRELSSDELAQPILIDEEGYVELEKDTPSIAKNSSQSNIKAVDANKYVEVTVKRGDALEKIARSNGTTVEAIKKINGLGTAKLQIGQVLRVPIGNNQPTAAVATNTAKDKPAAKPLVATNTAPKAMNGADPVYYTVKSGDSPWKIAKQFNVSSDDLLKLNGLTEESARNLKIGDKIRVR